MLYAIIFFHCPIKKNRECRCSFLSNQGNTGNFTARIRRMGEGNIFTLCVSPHLDVGGGTPARSGWWGGGTLVRSGWWGYPSQVWMMGGTLARSGWWGGYPRSEVGGTPGLKGVPHPRSEVGVPWPGLDEGYPIPGMRWWIPHPRSEVGVPHPKSGVGGPWPGLDGGVVPGVPPPH